MFEKVFNVAQFLKVIERLMVKYPSFILHDNMDSQVVLSHASFASCRINTIALKYCNSEDQSKSFKNEENQIRKGK